MKETIFDISMVPTVDHINLATFHLQKYNLQKIERQ